MTPFPSQGGGSLWENALVICIVVLRFTNRLSWMHPSWDMGRSASGHTSLNYAMLFAGAERTQLVRINAGSACPHRMRAPPRMRRLAWRRWSALCHLGRPSMHRIAPSWRWSDRGGKVVLVARVRGCFVAMVLEALALRAVVMFGCTGDLGILACCRMLRAMLAHWRVNLVSP